MRLQRMILRGFKSFAGTTELQFAPGVTAIVGPNGSGKSNIADAVRWVLGEQNVRQLRGREAGDVIFAGTETRRAQGAAEVTLVFDNAAGLVPGEAAEVAVTRRLLRNGTSEYFINKRSCRLRDIHYLFADTGLGKDSMAVIGQQKVDRILVGKPEERKLIFEEVAGITRYKLRKTEGMRKLQEAERNMERVHDVARVLAEELEPLAEKAAAAKRYEELSTRKRRLLATAAWQQWRSAQRTLTRVENEAIDAAAAWTAAQTALTAAEAERRVRLQENVTEREELRRLEQEASQAEQLRERLAGEFRSGEERLRLARENAAALSAQAAELAAAETALQTALAEQEKRIAELATELSAATVRERECEAEALRLQAAQAAYREARETQARAEAEYLTATELRTRELQRLEQEIARCDERARQEEAATATLREALTLATTALTAARERLAQSRDEAAKRTAAATAARQAETDARQQAQARETALEKWTERVRYLQHLAAEYEGYGRPTKEVLRATGAWRKGCFGTVGDVLQVTEPYLTAVSVALGGAVQHLVVADWETAKAAIRYLQQGRYGRTTFYPLAALRPAVLRDKDALAEKGVHGTAAACVQTAKEFAPLTEYLLGRTLVVEDLATAQRLATTYRQRLRMVTLDGQLIQPGGAIVGGSTAASGSGIFGRKQELAEAEERLAAVRATPVREVPSAAPFLAAQEKALQAVQAAEIDLATRGAEERALRERQTIQAERRRELAAERENLRAALAAKQAESIPAVPQVQATLAVPADDGGAREAWTQARVDVARLQAELRRYEDERARQRGEVAANRARRATETTACTAREEEIRRLERELTERETEFEQAQQDARAKRAACDACYETQAQRLAAERQAETAYEALRQTESRTRLAAAEKNTRREYALEETTRKEEEFRRFGYTAAEMEDVRIDGNMAVIRTELQAVDADIATLGPINPQAPTEYAAAQERSAFYAQQLADLEEARKALHEVVTEIDTTMRGRFNEAFAVVAEEFQRIFAHVFGGGQARLELVAATDEHPEGVEIYVRPPGKKQQALSLLSGGERALTVIALLFSFMAYRPAPFCLVDEIDAALDDANIERFKHYLAEGRQDIQFIVITHRKATMSAADRLQGVTMEEKGVSKLVTVDLQQYEEG